MSSRAQYALLALLAGLVATPAEAAEPSCRDDGPDLVVGVGTANTVKSENLDKVLAFVDRGTYLNWERDPFIRPTGDILRTTEGGTLDGSTHHRVRIYYSPRVAQWVRAQRPSKDAWVKQGNKAECYLPDGATIVKEMYKTEPPVYPDDDPVIGWSVMVRKNGASHDGWYWVIYFRKEFRSMETMGTFAYSFCYTCHASAASESTFASDKNLSGQNAASIEGRSYIGVVDPTFYKDLVGAPPPSPAPRPQINTAFKQLFDNPAIYPGLARAPRYEPEIAGPGFPNTDYDHVWRRTNPAEDSYITSDNCIGCHDATALVDTQVPNMLIRRPVKDPATGKTQNELLNLSAYGEWRASPMGMAGRDPVFFAQLESEMNTYPQKAADLQNLCLSCHGAMGQRQFVADKGHGQKFKLADVFKTDGADARYGALARDGISCMVCHQMDPKTVNAKENTGKFVRGPANLIFGSSRPDSPNGPIRTWPMRHALGLTPVYDPYVNKAEACAACHTIVLPAVNPEGVAIGKAHEQETFLEWYYSGYQNSNPAVPSAPAQAKTCQDCHMNATFQGNGKRVNFKVANVEDASWPRRLPENLAPEREITVPPRPEAGRHTLFGMNLFVLTFYDQFRPLFGLLPDSNPPSGTTDSFRFALDNGEWQARNATAEVKIVAVKRDGDYLDAQVRVTNKAGHKLPSGVGFRRAWLEFSVLDAQGKTIWASGRTDENGVMVRPDGAPLASEFTDDFTKLQPHWAVIGSQEQVQVYEERYIYKTKDGRGVLNTSFLGINEVVKDNRLLPRGFHYDYLRKNAAEAPGEDDQYESLLPASKLPRTEGAADPREDSDYTDGSGTDTVTYRIPLAQVNGAAAVHAQLNYQSLPPYYLRDRFAAGATPGGGSEQIQRLYYLAGHVNLEQSKIAGWKIKVQEDRAAIP